MDPVTQVLVLIVVLHVVDGFLLIRRQAFVFIGRGDAFSVASPGDGPFGNARAGFVALSPLPPFPVGYVAELPELTIGPDAVVPLPLQRVGRVSTPPDEVLALSEETLAGAYAEGKRVCSRGGIVLARTSSAAEARSLAQALNELAGLDARERAERFAERVRRSFDLEAFEARMEAFRREARGLGLLSAVALAVFVGTVYGILQVPWVYARWPFFAIFSGALIAHLLIEVARVHGWLHPGLVGDRIYKLSLLLVSPPALGRAEAWVAQDAFYGFHPMVLARSLLEGRSFEAFAAALWRDLRFPPGPDPEPVRATLAATRAAFLSGHRALLESAGIDPQDLEAPPEHDGASSAYCPRCHTQYAEASASCEDCPGVVCVPFPAAAVVPS